MRTICILLLCTIANTAMADRIEHRDRNGNVLGYDTQDGSRLIEHDRNGNVLGSWRREGDRMVHRDRNGNVLGYDTIKP